MKKLGGLLLALMFVAGCFGGDEEKPPPVTNTAYFDEKITALAAELVNNATKRVGRAAVLPFKNPQGQTSSFGKYLASKFTTISVKNRYFSIPSAGEVEDALQEGNINYQGSLDRDAANSLGRALNVDGIVVGLISDLQKGSDVDLTVQMIDTRSGTVISAANTSIYRSKSVSSMMLAF